MIKEAYLIDKLIYRCIIRNRIPSLASYLSQANYVIRAHFNPLTVMRALFRNEGFNTNLNMANAFF